MTHGLPGDARAFVELCDDLLHRRSDRRGRVLLAILLGEPDGVDLGPALERARRVVAAMTLIEQADPRAIGPVRRLAIAREADVDIADISELIFRMEAAMSFARDHPDELGPVRPHAPPAPSDHSDVLALLRERLDRDLVLWSFVSDHDPIHDH